MGKKSILASDPVTLPNGKQMGLVDFLAWAKTLDHDSPPQHGSGSLCTIADILATCFPCTGGPISGASPGPVCDWTFTAAFGGKGGQVSFAPGQMLMQMTANNDVPAAYHSIVLPNVSHITAQFALQEFASAPTNLVFYQLFLVGAGSVQALELKLIADGTLFLSVGPRLGGAKIYSGSWLPNGSLRIIDLNIISLLVTPDLYIDGVPIPLTLIGPGGINIGTLPANVAAFFATTGSGFPDTAVIESAFVTSGIYPPGTVYCC